MQTSTTSRPQLPPPPTNGVDHLPGLQSAGIPLSAKALPLKPLAWARLGARLATALEAAHASGVAHGELCIDSVMLTADKVVLFDLPMVLASRQTPALDDARLLARLPQLINTMAPERLRGAVATMASDVYSLAALLCLTAGSEPVPGNRVLEKLNYAAFIGWTPVLPSLPQAQNLLSCMLRFDANQRPLMADVASELHALLSSLEGGHSTLRVADPVAEVSINDRPTAPPQPELQLEAAPIATPAPAMPVVQLTQPVERPMFERPALPKTPVHGLKVELPRPVAPETARFFATAPRPTELPKPAAPLAATFVAPPRPVEQPRPFAAAPVAAAPIAPPKPVEQPRPVAAAPVAPVAVAQPAPAPVAAEPAPLAFRPPWPVYPVSGHVAAHVPAARPAARANRAVQSAAIDSGKSPLLIAGLVAAALVVVLGGGYAVSRIGSHPSRPAAGSIPPSLAAIMAAKAEKTAAPAHAAAPVVAAPAPAAAEDTEEAAPTDDVREAKVQAALDAADELNDMLLQRVARAETAQAAAAWEAEDSQEAPDAQEEEAVAAPAPAPRPAPVQHVAAPAPVVAAPKAAVAQPAPKHTAVKVQTTAPRAPAPQVRPPHSVADDR